MAKVMVSFPDELLEQVDVEARRRTQAHELAQRSAARSWDP
jgi:hypothetical protein